MKTLENIFSDVTKSKNFAQRITIGILLGLIPVINFLSFGYLSKFGQSSSKNKLILPEWPHSKDEIKSQLVPDFISGIMVFLEFLLFVIVPMIFFSCIFGIFGREEFGACAGLFLGTPIFAHSMAFEEPLTTNNFNQCFQKTTSILKRITNKYMLYIIPSLLFLCLQVLCYLLIPVYCLGASFFLGMIYFIAYLKHIQHED